MKPAIKPGGGQPAVRPSLPAGGLGGVSKPPVRPNLPDTNRPAGGNSNARPGTLPAKPDLPNTRPGINVPSQPITKPSLPPVGERPNLPNKPDRPNVTWPSKPDINPPNRPVPKNPIDPNRPGGGNRPVIEWPNRPSRPEGGGDRPNIPNRPGINLDGSHNTIVNRQTNNNVTVNNINNRNNFYNHNTNINNFGGYRPGVGNAIHGWNSAWYGNYNTWHRAYHPWYNGCWSGNIFNNWGVGPVGWGLSMWGLNSFRYHFGYTTYVNPFYIPPPATIVVPVYENYSQPIVNVVQALPESGQEPPPMPETSAQAFDAAQAAFKRGDYKTALTKSELALKDFPGDPVLHEFRALVLFALGQYRQSSAAIHALLASGPGWDWTTMSSLYPDTDTYSNQLASLQKAATAKPDDPSLQFLLAYHYMTVGDPTSAKDALTQAKKLLPTDPVVEQLAQAAGVEGTQVTPKDPPTAVDVKLDLTGAWIATRPDGGTISLVTTKEGGFTWTVTDKGGKKDSFDGTFTLEADLLILERKSGGALMGRITVLAANKFLFKVLGGGASDPGLTFAK
ncbi:MAG: hypothetical protein C0467_17665 [Planctomycetaceae bacterium]|nr:hypothetical protein [Planctomycetaceae bacterium]